jgi:hypothetical protein
MSAEKLEFRVNEEWQKLLKEYPWMSFVPEDAKDSKGNEYQRKRGSSVIYKKTDNGYICINCGSEIETAEVIHPVWDGPFPCSGSGKTAKETVPYCPKCEEKPNPSGTPIQC